jgi:hypothetical protein
VARHDHELQGRQTGAADKVTVGNAMQFSMEPKNHSAGITDIEVVQ